MALASPKLIVFDTATLGKVALDYWSPEVHSRDKARTFLAQLLERGVYIAITLTHVVELLRHQNEETVRDRIKFLRGIALLAWLRPYNGTWFPGGIPDLLCRELHAVKHSSAKDWHEIIEKVRPELWETGTGSEMFVDDERLWSIMMEESKSQHESEKYIASVARTDAGGINDVKIRDALKLPIRPKEERADYMRGFAQAMQIQMDRHGDKRFNQTREAANVFASSTLKRIEAIDTDDGDTIQRLLELQNIPKELVKPEMTIGDLGELAIYARQLRLLSENLNPAVNNISMNDVPLDTLPSYVVERKLRSIQQKADRVSGSDFGDGHIAPLIFYADGVEVDKRTCEFLGQIKRDDSILAGLMSPFIRSTDYIQILDQFEWQ